MSLLRENAIDPNMDRACDVQLTVLTRMLLGRFDGQFCLIEVLHD